MLNLLIVDDEPMFREGLIKTIDWKSLGIQIAAEAFNGVEALKALSENNIDLIITDIRMPEMDGLELIRRAGREYPDVRFIVLSAFDDFSQVKKAFQLGIVDYILKSDIQESELKEIIDRQRLEVRNRSESAKWDRTEYARKTKRLVFQQLLRNCVDRKLSLKETPELQEYFNYSEVCPVYAVTLCIHHKEYSLGKDLIIKEIQEGVQLIENLISDVIDDWTGYSDSPNIFLFHSPARELSWTDLSRRTETLRAESQESLNRKLPDLILSAGFSSVKKSSNLSRQKSEAEKACSYSFFRGIGTSIAYKHYQNSLEFPETDYDSLFRDFAATLKNRDLSKIIEFIKKYQPNPLRINGASRNVVIEQYRKYHYHLLSFYEQMGLDQEESITKVFDLFPAMEASSAPFSDLIIWLNTAVNLIYEKMSGRHSLTKQVCRYLNNNYSRDLSLTEVAEYFNVNSSYLSRVFSKEEGKGFAAYLLDLRIRKAIELLERRNLKIYEVSEQVGMMNPESFSRGFKKVTGLSPSEYVQ
ncbi:MULTISPECIES: response regulator [unclassified Oceanispirochaeta]|uniref:response regulator transcription factor n=1 Tax=unclassified Oceanispirochaeta TaxID=2635722 RepID=UPI000E09A700|nr:MULTISPECIES: response regulator [unclassified Oceanispirochaeta]MBF9016402.1 response regulator [Oceanispirochaeta sp. M2]NPD72864.1 response regulator [Oceanispirochaeta sp. M1]RDG31442.1 response regulator [Oceanispirochaeta sp. M1]